MIKKTLISIVAVLGLFVFTLEGQCVENQGDIFLSPMIGGHVFEGNQDIDDGPTFGVGVGYLFTNRCGLEAVFNRTESETDPGDVDVEVYPVRLDAFYNLLPKNDLVPYIAAGLGGIKFSADDFDDDTDFMVNYGAGIKYFISDSFAFRGDVRHLVSFDETQSNLIFTVGLVMTFGGQKAEAKPVAQQVITDKDSDGDGIMDSVDECSNTPKGVKVDSTGCPLDSDKDGVADYKDKCPGTARGVKVDEKGCPVQSVEMDSDMDGISDNKDKCPGTPSGVKVDARGCWVVRDLKFETAKATIMESSYRNLDEVISVMKINPELKLEIQGYTDNKGSVAYNQALSEKRAQAVKGYFVSKGIADDRLTTKGYGMENPAESNDTPEGRAMNRRVELKPMF